MHSYFPVTMTMCFVHKFWIALFKRHDIIFKTLLAEWRATVSFKEIFEKADQFAKRFGQKISDEQLQDFILTCIPYFMYLRNKFKYLRICTEDIEKEIAPSAISQAFLIQERRKILFSYCLQNAFRDCCREKLKRLREHDMNDIVSECDIDESREVVGGGIRYPSPQVKVQDNELVELANNILENHNRFSKQVVYQKSRGSTYPEMVDIFSTTLNECKRVYWHDINDLRKKLNPNPEEE